MGGESSGKDGDFDHFDVIVEGQDYKLFLAVDYTPDFVLVTLIHNPKELNQSDSPMSFALRTIAIDYLLR